MLLCCSLVLPALSAPPRTSGVEVEVGTTETATVTPVPAAPTAAAAEAEPTSDTVTALQTDAEAASSAEKILPVPGSTLESTEQRSLDGAASVAQPPSVQLKPDGSVVLNDGQSSEAVAVKSAAELLKMLGLKPPAPRPAEGYESDEESTATKFDVDAIQRLIGREPTVVYRVVVDNTPLPDPMIVPWIRNQKLLEETFNKAIEKLANNELDDGRAMLLDILTQYPNTEYAQQAKEILEKINQVAAAGPPKKSTFIKAPAPVDIQINPNVKVGTVIADPANSADNRVMINGRVYKIGDAIRSFPNHKVVGITEDSVTLEVELSGQKRSFDVPVRPNVSQ
ncbi:MAG: hypothetical protein ACR2IE_15170 [Candidatus Sumerlaeaceae bacterium]